MVESFQSSSYEVHVWATRINDRLNSERFTATPSSTGQIREVNANFNNDRFSTGIEIGKIFQEAKACNVDSVAARFSSIANTLPDSA